jgi:hypothetical protein
MIRIWFYISLILKNMVNSAPNNRFERDAGIAVILFHSNVSVPRPSSEAFGLVAHGPALREWA